MMGVKLQWNWMYETLSSVPAGHSLVEVCGITSCALTLSEEQDQRSFG